MRNEAAETSSQRGDASSAAPRRPRRRRTARELVFTAGTLVLLATLALLAGELVVRLVAPQQLIRPYFYATQDSKLLFRPHQDYHDQLGLPMYAYHVRTNGLGLRMDHEVDLSPARRRVLVVGDSYTFGWGVEFDKSFLGIVAARLEDDSPNVQLVNGGMGGASTGHIFRNLQRLFPKLAPCGVVHFLSPNDPFDNINRAVDYRVTAFERGDDGRITLHDVEQYSRAKRLLLDYTPYQWLNQHSHLFIAFKNGIAQLSKFRFSEDRSPTGPNVGFDLDRPGTDSDYSELLLDVTMAHLRRFDDYVSKSGGSLLIVWIPSWTELYEPAYPINSFFNELKQRVASSLDSSFYDPLQTLHESVSGSREMMEFFFPDGQPAGHMTEIGNALYADAVASTLVRFVDEACAP